MISARRKSDMGPLLRQKSKIFQAMLPLLVVLLAWTMKGHAQDEDAGNWPGFNADNTVRGTVTASGPSTFTIRTDEGTVYKVLYSVNSRFLANRGPAKPSDIHMGDMLIATGNVDPKAKSVGAAVLIGIDAEEVKKAREGLGKTWTAGRITSIDVSDSPRITLARLDGATQTISVDENTSFKHRRDSITLGDIKTGDSLRADGHISGKLFLATVVYVFNPGEHRDPAIADRDTQNRRP